MEDKETILQQLHFRTADGLVPAGLRTEDGVKPFFVNVELTDAIRAAHELTSINQSTKDKFSEVASEHWGQILEYAENKLMGQDLNEDSRFEAMMKAFEFYVDNQDLCDIFFAILRSLIKGH
ncbi:hypothetical protein F0247_23055 [Vibrio crassostreae]|uniref:hypothetical protein n=1 Tax=Vibrio crassostreae TaxID=246167 RepID=UPI00148BC077|nr:hypothetical protein [Vibrio crassostreae]NOH77899.1 hypothetical protein [Vibrio crassostreae]